MSTLNNVPERFNRYIPMNGHVLIATSGLTQRRTQGGIFIPDGVKDVGGYFMLGKIVKASEDCPDAFKQDHYVAIRTFGDESFMRNNGIDQEQIEIEGKQDEKRVVNLISLHYSQISTLISKEDVEIEEASIQPEPIVKPITSRIKR